MSAAGDTELPAGSREGEQDWRLEVELDVADAGGALHSLLGRLRGPNVVKEIEATVPGDVVITHDGRLLFAYAALEASLGAARSAIEGVLRRDGLRAKVRVSRWEDESDSWRQTDPPLSAEERLAVRAAERDADALQTRTMVATSGKLVRTDFEQSMRAWAERLGLECDVVEHPHLLTTQIAFTVTGPRRKVDEFAQGLAAEGWRYVRTEDAVMFNPL